MMMQESHAEKVPSLCAEHACSYARHESAVQSVQGEAALLDQRSLEQVLGFKIFDMAPFIQAFTHKSGTKLTNGPSYERFEFMGDAVINLVVGKFLFDTYKHADEGFLTRLRTKLVSGDCLAQLARKLGLHNFVIMNQRSMQHGFNTNTRILEDVFEALVGCIYTFNGLATAKTFILSAILRFVNFQDVLRDDNYKDGLMRYAQARGMPLPTYHVLKTVHGPCSTFIVNVTLGSASGQGMGQSKKHAEQEAARHLLYLFGGLTHEGGVGVCGRTEKR